MSTKELFGRMGVHTVVDGQFGSTGKGVIAAWLAQKAGEQKAVFDGVVSNAGPNSGHTFYDKAGIKHVLKQLPTFAVAQHVDHWGYPIVYLSAGAIIDPEILAAEAIKYSGIEIWVHPMAAVITAADKEAEHSGSVAAVAGTRSGTGHAIARKVLRDHEAVFRFFFEANPYFFPANVQVGEMPMSLPHKKRVFMEISQGFSLGLNSQFYPKVTSRECTVMQGLADARISPVVAVRTYLSMRTFPIRVGNVDGYSSGDCYSDQMETSWDVIKQTPELTTVTQRVRRVFTFSEKQALEAIWANTPDFIFLNFMNYLNEDGQRDLLERMDKIRNLAPFWFDVIQGHGHRSEDVKW